MKKKRIDRLTKRQYHRRYSQITKFEGWQKFKSWFVGKQSKLQEKGYELTWNTALKYAFDEERLGKCMFASKLFRVPAMRELVRDFVKMIEYDVTHRREFHTGHWVMYDKEKPLGLITSSQVSLKPNPERIYTIDKDIKVTEKRLLELNEED